MKPPQKPTLSVPEPVREPVQTAAPAVELELPAAAPGRGQAGGGFGFEPGGRTAIDSLAQNLGLRGPSAVSKKFRDKKGAAIDQDGAQAPMRSKFAAQKGSRA